MKTVITEKPDYELANDEAKTLYESLGIVADVSMPIPGVKDEWPHILYRFTFLLPKTGNSLTTEYRMGVGHVKWPKTFESIPCGAPADMIPVFNTIRQNPGAQLKDKSAHARAAAFLAQVQKVKPQAHEVFACICNDAITAHGTGCVACLLIVIQEDMRSNWMTTGRITLTAGNMPVAIQLCTGTWADMAFLPRI